VLELRDIIIINCDFFQVYEIACENALRYRVGWENNVLGVYTENLLI